ncbi:hypothetical protein B484DRAFT_463552 [Ochromonadaceae sp. CCMP2298]|nr:hypothetical protein B484DRAFT_463552 [Ochromonadaceae sp. CCMP2298]
MEEEADRNDERAGRVVLSWFNVRQWKKWIKHIITGNGDAGVEIKERKHMVYQKPMRTESVTEETGISYEKQLMSNGDIVSETRPWAAVRDQNTLNAREATYAKKLELIKSNRGKVWTILIKHCTPIILSAVEQEPTYLQVQTECDSLKLYLLMEKVCLKRAMNNAEAHRTRWYELKYLLGGNIFGFFNEFKEMKDNILQATAEEESIKDPDMVYRLREAMPESISKVVLLDTHTLTKENADYPKYTPCKNKVVNYVCYVLYTNQNYEKSSVGTALLSTRESPDVYRQKKAGKPKATTAPVGKCYNCDSTDHLANACPNDPERCNICGKTNHTPPNCKFNKENPGCYPDIKAGTSETAVNKRVRNPKRSQDIKGGGKTGAKRGGKSYAEIPGNYISRSGTALGANRGRNTDSSVEEEELEDEEIEEQMRELEDEEPEEGEITEGDTTQTPMQIHVTINGIVYEASDMQSLDAILRPHITRPQNNLPSPAISITAPDCQFPVSTAQTAPPAPSYIPSYIQPRTKAQHTAAQLLQEAYDSKLEVPTDADRTLAAQTEMYKTASRTSCMPVEEEWKEIKGKNRRAKPTYKEDIFASSSNSESEQNNKKMPPATQHSLYVEGEEGTKFGVDAGKPQSPAELQQQEEDDHAYAQALQLQEDGEEEAVEEEAIKEEAVIEAQTQVDPPEEEDIRLQDNKGPFLKDPKNYRKLINLVRPPIHNKFSRAGEDGIGTPGTDPDHDVRRPFDNSDIKRYRRKLIKSGNKKALRELNQLVGWRCIPGEPVIYKGPTPPPSEWIPQRRDIKNAYLNGPVPREHSYLSLTPEQRAQHSNQ